MSPPRRVLPFIRTASPHALLPPHHLLITMTNAVYPTAHTTQVANPRLKLLNQLKSGQKGVMTFMAIPSVRMAQIVALCGFDVRTKRLTKLIPGGHH